MTQNEALLGRAQLQDEMGHLYEEYSGIALRYARGMLRSGQDAEDVVNDAFAAVFDRMADGVVIANPRAYLLQAVRNRSYNLGRRKETAAADFDLECFLGGDSSMDGLEFALNRNERELVAAAYGTLGEREREILWLVDVEGQGYAEVATTTGLSRGGLAHALFNARRALTEAFVAVQLPASPGVGAHPSAREISRYARGSLGKRSRAVVHPHVEACVACSLLVAEAVDLGSSIRRLVNPAYSSPALVALAVATAGSSIFGGLASFFAPFLTPVAVVALVGGILLVAGGVVAGVVGQPGSGAESASLAGVGRTGTSQSAVTSSAPRDSAGMTAAWSQDAESALRAASSGATTGAPTPVTLDFLLTGTGGALPRDAVVTVDLPDGLELDVSQPGACSVSGSRVTCGPVAPPERGHVLDGALHLLARSPHASLPGIRVEPL